MMYICMVKKRISMNKTNLELYNEKKDCCGCAACYTICPKKAITMTIDEEGFFYPKINEAMCVKCYLCLSVCPIKWANAHL